MSNHLIFFEKRIKEHSLLSTLHEFVCANIKAAIDFDDILRAELVYGISAFDKFIHDIIKSGMVDIFIDKRLPTKRYLCETINLETFRKIESGQFPPKEIVFEQEISRKLSYLSFQFPEKISDGLSLIWEEKNKWKRISAITGGGEQFVKTRMRLIADRRNSIVHEADWDDVQQVRRVISVSDCKDSILFLVKVARAIDKLVT